MGLQDSVSWYQKKIGTYDKQQWEKTVEQRILHGLTHVLKKTAKLKTDLIDVDLVRGSSFPKAKPKHGLITVTKLAFIRWLFLPLYSYWWIQQTCFSIFSLLLILYILEICNLVIYFKFQDNQILEHVSAYEVVIPAAMMLVLSIIHSQIVSTNSSSSLTLQKSKSKRRRVKRRGTNVERNKSYTLDCKSESCPNKTSLQSNFRYANKDKDNASKSPKEEECSGRTKIIWCSPPEEATDTEPIIEERPRNSESTKSEGGNDNHNLKPPNVEDDGFESLNGNGSSENGDENQDGVNCEEVIRDAERTTEGRSHFKRINFLIDDNVEKLPNRSGEESCSNYEESLGAVKKCNDCSVTELFKIDKCCKSQCRVNDNSEDIECDDVSWVEDLGGKKCPVICRRRSAPGLCSPCETCEHETDHKDTDSDGSHGKLRVKKSTSPQRLLQRRRGSLTLQAHTARNYYNSSCESDDGDRFDGPHLTEGTTSAAEWIGITTNSEECSVTSEIDESEGPNESKVLDDHPFAWEFQLSPSSIVSPSCAASDKVSCTIWENKDVKRADLSVLDISSAIIARVETMQESMDYFYAGLCVSVVISLLPSFCRVIETAHDNSGVSSEALTPHFHVDPVLTLSAVDISEGILMKISQYFPLFLNVAFGSTFIERFVIITAMFERFMLSALFFFLVAVAKENIQAEIPIREIFQQVDVLSTSYLKKRGPQRSVDVIVSAAFIITLLLLSFLSVELLKDSVRLHSEYNLEALVWCLVLGVYILRFMTLGNKTNRKYRNLSVLLTEQINLYLQIEQKPNKKEELMVANSVLKLAADLLKELESPFKISGLSANPYVYTITKVVILSALSGVLSEMLGFKLKLHKIKIK
ncbi:UNVERIFIED_CONTAM: hypothetical protein PYX00_002933 [Menopon gallinae]|uniref:PHTF1/2 N-terminal domain-containing protein n=1 Tax=Menopon gallinae TaxID=328185 RepID=A0AAW2HZE2_9NEOP